MVKHTQTIRRQKLPTNCLSVFDHFVRLALKGLILACIQINNLLEEIAFVLCASLLTSNSHHRVNSFSTLDQVSKILTFFNDITETNDKYKYVFTSSKITHVD